MRSSISGLNTKINAQLSLLDSKLYTAENNQTISEAPSAYSKSRTYTSNQLAVPSAPMSKQPQQHHLVKQKRVSIHLSNSNTMIPINPAFTIIRSKSLNQTSILYKPPTSFLVHSQIRVPGILSRSCVVQRRNQPSMNLTGFQNFIAPMQVQPSGAYYLQRPRYPNRILYIPNALLSPKVLHRNQTTQSQRLTHTQPSEQPIPQTSVGAFQLYHKKDFKKSKISEQIIIQDNIENDNKNSDKKKSDSKEQMSPKKKALKKLFQVKERSRSQSVSVFGRNKTIVHESPKPKPDLDQFVQQQSETLKHPIHVDRFWSPPQVDLAYNLEQIKDEEEEILNQEKQIEELQHKLQGRLKKYSITIPSQQGQSKTKKETKIVYADLRKKKSSASNSFSSSVLKTSQSLIREKTKQKQLVGRKKMR